MSSVHENSPKYFVVGLTHIDLAWKKDSVEHEEIMEKAVLQLIDVLDTDPGYTYLIEQAAHYRTMLRRRPDLVQRLRAHIQRGRLEFVGGMASTLETNGPSGESFVRNQLLGLNFAREVFGAPVRTGYLIDTFGTHAQVPQILKQLGLKGLLANRFGGSLAKDVFVVRGLDGTPLLVAGRDANSPYVARERVFFGTARSNTHIRQLFDEAAATAVPGPCLVMPYTEYDGIASRHVRTLVEEQNAKHEGPTWAFATISEFFDALAAQEGRWPEYDADLNPEFTGTFGQRVIIRAVHRRAEGALLAADTWSALLLRPDQSGSTDAWWKLAFVQSHDVYTGSHPTVVFDETMARLRDIERYASDRLGSCASSLTTPPGSTEVTLVAMNGLPWRRDAVVETAVPGEARSFDIVAVTDGEADLPFEVEGDRLRFRATFPGISAKRIALRLTDKRAEAAAEPGLAPSANPIRTHATVANEFVSVEANLANGIRIYPAGTEGRSIGLDITLQEDRGSFQIEDLRAADVSSNVCILHVEKPETTAIGSQIIVRGRFPRLWTGHANPLEWEATCRIYPGKPQVDLTVKLDWRGEASRIRLGVSTGFESSTGIFEVPFGAVKRTPYHSRRTAKGEWPAHRWVAVEENGVGVALVNTGSSSAEVTGGHIRATLLRAPVVEYAGMVPDETSSQHGNHVFAFSVLPYRGSWSDGKVIQLGQDLNSPIQCFEQATGSLADTGELLGVSPSTVVLSGVKSPEDGTSGEVVIRVYEASGRPTTARLQVKGAESAWRSDLREIKGAAIEVAGETVTFDLTPFEIGTIRVRKSVRAR